MASALSTLAAPLIDHLRAGTVIPAHPLALTPERTLDERRQRALTRYYCAAGAGGVAIGVHTTQFAIREPDVGLLEPVLALAAETVDAALGGSGRAFLKVAGVCGPTVQAVAEARLAREHGYHLGLLSLAALPEATDEELLTHCREVATVLPVMGFYLQPAVGGRVLGYGFWRAFVEIEHVVAIKVAPFSRYRTLDVVRAVADAGRAGEVALYTGNDDAIVTDLLTPFAVGPRGPDNAREVVRVVGGLLGQWAVWTWAAVALHRRCRVAARDGAAPGEIDGLLAAGAQLTDANAAIFDAAHGFRGCIAGIHEVLRRQALLRGTWCLDPGQTLSPGQADEIARVHRAYPYLHDDAFVAAHRDEWLAD
jgi:dihydrodipicolinate synthase/N-acetylneuraminate lyase